MPAAPAAVTAAVAAAASTAASAMKTTALAYHFPFLRHANCRIGSNIKPNRTEEYKLGKEKKNPNAYIRHDTCWSSPLLNASRLVQ